MPGCDNTRYKVISNLINSVYILFFPSIHTAAAINYKHLLVARHPRIFGDTWDKVSGENHQMFTNILLSKCVFPP